MYWDKIPEKLDLTQAWNGIYKLSPLPRRFEPQVMVDERRTLRRLLAPTTPILTMMFEYIAAIKAASYS